MNVFFVILIEWAARRFDIDGIVFVGSYVCGIVWFNSDVDVVVFVDRE